MIDDLVTSLAEVKSNIEQFNQDLKAQTDIVNQLTQFKHWYYIPSIDSFGPSKYIGYKDMDTERYDRGKRKTGVDTERELKQWFIKLPKESQKSLELMAELERLFFTFDKWPRSNAYIHVLKNGIRI
ncbi:hypothetical protein J7E35_19710 [Bacillus sp. ISL-45]|nr:hypothetical protein [Bacillus sp. ISL-45]